MSNVASPVGENAVDDPYAGLNPPQRAAVEHGFGDGAGEGAAAGSGIGAPLLVIAGAGSGKTNTLAHRVARLIRAAPIPSASCC